MVPEAQPKVKIAKSKRSRGRRNQGWASTQAAEPTPYGGNTTPTHETGNKSPRSLSPVGCSFEAPIQKLTKKTAKSFGGSFGAQPSSGFGRPSGGFGQPSGGFGQPSGGFGQPSGGFGAGNYGAQIASDVSSLDFGRTSNLEDILRPGGNPEYLSKFQETIPPQSDVSKLLLLVSKLHKDYKITEQEKSQLKEKIIRRESAVVSALEVFEIERDFDELADSLKRICKC